MLTASYDRRLDTTTQEQSRCKCLGRAKLSVSWSDVATVALIQYPGVCWVALTQTTWLAAADPSGQV